MTFWELRWQACMAHRDRYTSLEVLIYQAAVLLAMFWCLSVCCLLRFVCDTALSRTLELLGCGWNAWLLDFLQIPIWVASSVRHGSIAYFPSVLSFEDARANPGRRNVGPEDTSCRCRSLSAMPYPTRQEHRIRMVLRGVPVQGIWYQCRWPWTSL
jgi:hypothetical protein